MFNWPWWIVQPILAFHTVPEWVWIVFVIVVAALLGRWLL